MEGERVKRSRKAHERKEVERKVGIRKVERENGKIWWREMKEGLGKERETGYRRDKMKRKVGKETWHVNERKIKELG